MPEQPQAPSLSTHAAHGFAWAVIQSVLARVVGIVCQFALAKLLNVEDFGAVAIAMSISTFVAVIQLSGLQEILVQRQARFAVWANAAFWMAFTLGLASAVLVAALGPVVAWWKSNPILTPLMLIVAAQSIVSSLQILPTASLQVHLRLRTITLFNLLQSTGGVILSVVLAALGLGAYSLVLGPLATSVIVLVLMWRTTRPRIQRHFHRRRWRFLWSDSSILLAVGFINNFVAQGAVFFLGLTQPERIVGLFFWAFMLSIQTIVLVTGNLNIVFFPTLTKLQNDPPRMLQAFLRAARVLAMIGVPACFLQAACAPWFIDLVFKDKWDDAVPAAVLLSIGLAFGVLSSVPLNLLKARGLFKRILAITIGYTALYVTVVGTAIVLSRTTLVPLSPPTLTALAIALVYAIAGPVGAYACIHPFGGTWTDVRRIFAFPVLCSALATASAWYLASLLPSSPSLLFHFTFRDKPLTIDANLIARLATVVLITFTIYLPLARLSMRSAFDEVLERGLTLLGRRRAIPATN